MNAETYSQLPPDVHRLIKNMFCGDDVTEVQINYVCSQNGVDRETFDEAVEFINNHVRRDTKFTTFVAVAILFTALQLLIWSLSVLF